jgi:hypothetical protein
MYPLCWVLLYTKFTSGGECILKKPDTKLGSLAKDDIEYPSDI